MGKIIDTRESDALYATALHSAFFKGSGATTDIRLFNNNIVPDRGTVLADLIEPTFAGYNPVVVAAWGELHDPVTSEIFQIALAPGVFSLSSGPGDTIYGAFITDGAGGVLAVERFDTPQIIVNPGDSVIFLPKLYQINVVSGPDGLED